jgi:hypothetical protein
MKDKKMDNLSLQPILSQSATQNFWIKTIGVPGQAPDPHQLFTSEKLTVEFSSRPDSIEIGDILFVHRIVLAKVVYVAICQSAARQVTAQEIRLHPFKEHWCWTMELLNLTPMYGRVWAIHKIKPFTLVNRFNELFPEEEQNLGSLQYGSGHQRISSKFGAFLLQKIVDIP